MSFAFDARLDKSTLERFEMMRLDTLVQLRDSLANLLNDENMDRGIIQARYLFESMRRLLVDENTRMDIKGLQCAIVTNTRITWTIWTSIYLLHSVVVLNRGA